MTTFWAGAHMGARRKHAQRSSRWRPALSLGRSLTRIGHHPQGRWVDFLPYSSLSRMDRITHAFLIAASLPFVLLIMAVGLIAGTIMQLGGYQPFTGSDLDD